MKNSQKNIFSPRRVMLLVMLCAVALLLCACSAGEEEITGIWKGKVSDFSERDAAMADNDVEYYLHIKGGGAFDIFMVQENNGKITRNSLLKQPGTYRLTGGWLTLNEAAATKPYVEKDQLTLKNDDGDVLLQRAYEVTYEFTGNVPKNRKNKVPQDKMIYDLGDPYTVETTFKAGDVVELKDSEGNTEHYTFLGWNNEGGTIDGNVLISGEWTMEKIVNEPVTETNE